MSQLTTRQVVTVMVVAMGLIAMAGFLPNQNAMAHHKGDNPQDLIGSCADSVTGAGFVPSPTCTDADCKDKARFSFHAGWDHDFDDLKVKTTVHDEAAGVKVKALTIDSYVGYHCVDASGLCFDRSWTGMAEVEINGVKQPTDTCCNYLMEAIDFGEPGKGIDFIHFATFGYVIAGSVLSGGNIEVHKPDDATFDCN